MQRLITERDRKKSNQLFLSLANNTLIGVGVIQENVFTFVNRRFASMVGYERQDLLKLRDITQVLPDYNQPLFTEKIKEQRIEGRLQHINGSSVDIELCFICARYDDSDALVLFILDISERKANERATQLSALIYKNASEAIAITDEDGIVVDINPAFTKITGYALADVVGQPMSILSSGRQSRNFYKKMWAQLVATGRWQGDIWNRRKDGTEYAERLSISTCYHDDGSVFRRIGLFFDVTQHKTREEQIWRQANYDHLTALPNRQMFQTRLQDAIQNADSNNKEFALIFLDLDLFKDVNDTLGHDVGDLLLKEVGKRLLSCVRDSDTVARIGGDEFTVIVADVANPKIVERICEEILAKIAQPYILEGHTATVSASIGVTMYPEDANNSSELLKNADMAMYTAKECGRNQYCFYMPVLREAIQARVLFSQNLQTAMTENQFILYYQPIVNMRTGEVTKFEALIRWRHPELGLVPPSEYIPFAEDSGLIVDIGDWVFNAAIKQAKKWHEQGHKYQLSVNVSPAQFYTDGVKPENWIKALKEACLPPASIVIEITERLLLAESPLIRERLHELRDAGFKIALDDFGTGFSSLTYLKRYPIDSIKIDQSFVRNLAPFSEDLALCEAMIMMAQKLGLEVIAEGVEGIQQESLLLEASCVFGQGYLYSRPVPIQELESWLLERKGLKNANIKMSDQITTGQLPHLT